MFRKKSTDEGSNFWISYADLMAGLLFVFILLIGAIVSKSVILKGKLDRQESRLAQLSTRLTLKEENLTRLSKELALSQALLTQQSQALQKQDHDLNATMQTLAQKQLRIRTLRKMLQESEAKQKALSLALAEQRSRFHDYNTTTQSKLVHYATMLATLQRRLEGQQQELEKMQGQKREERVRYDALLAKMQRQKAQIRALTGIKLQVITALKEALGDKIDIDKKSGSLKLSSNILFDKGSAVLKEEAKTALKEAFEEYIGTLMRDRRIKPHLDKIIIEGHTDSDGGYLYNLELSQKRAFAVMNYLLTLDIAKRYNLKPLLVASGRAYLDAVKVNGVEDKEASRRIEIKFTLKNEDAMHEIERVLDAQ